MWGDVKRLTRQAPLKGPLRGDAIFCKFWNCIDLERGLSPSYGPPENLTESEAGL